MHEPRTEFGTRFALRLLGGLFAECAAAARIATVRHVQRTAAPIAAAAVCLAARDHLMENVGDGTERVLEHNLQLTRASPAFQLRDSP